MDEFNHFFPLFGKGVLGLGWDYSVYFSFDKTIGFQFSQLGGEHFVRDVGNVFAKFSVAHDLFAKSPKDGCFPGATYLLHNQLNGVVIDLSFVYKIRHGYPFVLCKNRQILEDRQIFGVLVTCRKCRYT